MVVDIDDRLQQQLVNRALVETHREPGSGVAVGVERADVGACVDEQVDTCSQSARRGPVKREAVAVDVTRRLIEMAYARSMDSSSRGSFRMQSCEIAPS